MTSVRSGPGDKPADSPRTIPAHKKAIIVFAFIPETLTFYKIISMRVINGPKVIRSKTPPLHDGAPLANNGKSPSIPLF